MNRAGRAKPMHAMRGRLLRGGTLAATLIALAACGADSAYLDPYQKPYTWQPTGAPTANVAAQLVNPRDLAIGHGINEGDSKASGLAVERIWQDRPKQLTGGGSTAGAGATAAGGTGGTN